MLLAQPVQARSLRERDNVCIVDQTRNPRIPAPLFATFSVIAAELRRRAPAVLAQLVVSRGSLPPFGV